MGWYQGREKSEEEKHCITACRAGGVGKEAHPPSAGRIGQGRSLAYAPVRRGPIAALGRRDQNLRAICDTHLPGRYAIEIVDLIRHPEQAKADQIVAVPTLVKQLPVPVRHIIGDLSATERVLISLELRLA